MTHTHTPVLRGIQSVHAEANIAGLVNEVNASFATFKAEHTKQLEKAADDITKLQDAVDATDMKIAASEMNGPGLNRTEAAPPVSGPKAFRTYAGFKGHYAKAAQGTEKIGITDFVRGIAGMSTTDGVRAALSVGSNTAGGYSVPSTTAPEILAAMVPQSSLLTAGAGIVLLPEGVKTLTTAVIDTIPQASWRLEKGGIAESDPAFRGVVATPQSLAFFFKISRELLADGVGVELALQTAIAQAFAKEIDRAGLMGSGTSPEPRGIRNTPGVNIIDSGTDGAALTGYSKFMEGIGALLNADAPMPTAAIVAPRTLVGLGGLVDSTGQPLRKPEMLATMPIIGTSQIPIDQVAGASSDCSEIYLGDFTKMHFLMRENISIQLLREAFSATGEIGFLCHARLDAVVTHPQAFAVVTGVRG